MRLSIHAIITLPEGDASALLQLLTERSEELTVKRLTPSGKQKPAVKRLSRNISLQLAPLRGIHLTRQAQLVYSLLEKTFGKNSFTRAQATKACAELKIPGLSSVLSKLTRDRALKEVQP